MTTAHYMHKDTLDTIMVVEEPEGAGPVVGENVTLDDELYIVVSVVPYRLHSVIAYVVEATT